MLNIKHLTCLLQPWSIPKLKWEVVTMDYTTRSPTTLRKHNSSMVVVDKLSRVTHFTIVKINYMVEKNDKITQSLILCKKQSNKKNHETSIDMGHSI